MYTYVQILYKLLDGFGQDFSGKLNIPWLKNYLKLIYTYI